MVPLRQNMDDSTNNIEILKQLGERLLEPELYNQIVERLPDALIVIDREGRIVIFNDQATLMFNYHPSEVIGGPLSMLIPEQLRIQHDAHLQRWFDEPRARPMGLGLTLQGISKDNRIFSVEINLSPLIAPSGIYGMAVIRRPKVGETSSHVRT